MEDFILVIVVIAATLNVTLFFKIWGMTNNVSKINDKVGKTDSNSYIWIGDTENAYRHLCTEMYEELSSYSSWHSCILGNFKMTYDSVEIFNKTIEKYNKKFRAIGKEIPKQLSSIEGMKEYAEKMK